MRNRHQILLDALGRELAHAEQKAAKAKAEADECANVTVEMIAINREFLEIVQSGASGPAVIKRLAALKARDQRARRILRKDFVKLLDAQFHAEADCKAVAEELGFAKMRAAWAGHLGEAA